MDFVIFLFILLLCSSSLGEEFYKRVDGGFVDVDLSDRKLSLRTLV